MCENCPDTSNPDAIADALFTDIAKAKNDNVFFTPENDDNLTVTIAAVEKDDKHKHYFGFKDTKANKVLAMIEFDCESYHEFLASARQLDGLDSEMMTKTLESLFGPPNFN